MLFEVEGSFYRAFLAARDKDFFEAAWRPSRRSAFEDARERTVDVVFLLGTLAAFVVRRSFLSRRFRRLTLCRRREFHPSRRAFLSQWPVGRAHAVLATSNVLNLFLDKLPRFGRRSFSFQFSFARSSQSLFLWHHAASTVVYGVSSSLI